MYNSNVSQPNPSAYCQIKAEKKESALNELKPLGSSSEEYGAAVTEKYMGVLWK